MRATELLRELAEKTTHAPEPPGAGRYHYVHTVSSFLHTKRFLSRTGEDRLTAAVEPSERRQWIAADGSGRLLVTRGEEVLVPPSGDYAPGRLPSLRITGEESLATTLGRLGSPTTSGVMKAFEQVWNLQVVPPALQRLLLLHLAKCADLSMETTDFTGRQCIAVTHVDNARHRRKLLAFVQETGALIGAEELALEGAKVPIPVPAVVSTTTWLHSGYREMTTPPAGR
ncbi:hypothetical protein SAMN04488074_107129 [Lentzea albidocapillata subsp. violacea]|uniref:Uncharacterized protein n=1 Tax=Lentzea albidocapillata subsp. violacea TaxID=128104 RepID=A0A1G9EQ23_9PSEU|nr:hypothetical protein [Lentzea albidocapillata]SDK78230.1 hypothetical protein SAMN04488074_107129 [Lentzea albidocapillata subsp. violacea]